MSARPVIAIFDVGKTNKKLFLFDEDYQIVYERSGRFLEIKDEDDFPCENLDALRLSVLDSLREIARLKQFELKAVNFSAYGASFVCIDEQGQPLAPLYNYLKSYPEELSESLYQQYGGREQFSLQTASPVLGSLNSGLQLYRVKKENPDLFRKIFRALHLPQYLSFLLTGKAVSDLTSIGCHTALWDFSKDDYHSWVKEQGIISVLAPLHDSDEVFETEFEGRPFLCGVGLHDSSAALFPYLVNFREPFMLISTGTWCISLNPFNDQALTSEELEDDCLCYLQVEGKPVKSSRLFSGREYEEQIKRIASHFNEDVAKYRNIRFDPKIVHILLTKMPQSEHEEFRKKTIFDQRRLDAFENGIEAYYQLMLDLVQLQIASSNLILKGVSVKKIFVDGGFNKNSVFMHLLAAAFPQMEVFAASMAQATALGAALSIHTHWNEKSVPNDLIELHYYSANQQISL